MDSLEVVTVDKFGHRVGQAWTTRQLAETAQLSPSRIRQLVANGELQHNKIAPRLNLIPYAEGIRFLESIGK